MASVADLSPGLQAGAALDRSDRRASRLILLAMLLLVGLASVQRALTKPIDVGFDELAHTSYIAQLQSSDVLWVDLGRLHSLDARTMRLTQGASYLNHPSFYYRLAAWAGPGVEGDRGALLVHRLMNVAIVLAGVWALLVAPVRAGWTVLQRYAYSFSLVTIPVLAPLAGSVSNDNLAFAGGALAIWGAFRLFEDAPCEAVAQTSRRWGLGLLCLGVLIAGLTKLTGMMLVGGFALTLGVALTMRRKLSPGSLACIVAAVALASIPYVAFVLAYGSPAPNTPAQAAMLLQGSIRTGWNAAPRLGPAAYVWHFLQEFFLSWLPTLDSRSALNLTAAVLPAMVVVLAGAGAGIAALRLRAPGGLSAPGAIAVSGLVATAGTFVVHIAFSYQRHLQTGWLLDAAPRYYLPLAAAVPIAVINLTDALPARWRPWAVGLFLAEPVAFAVLATPLR
ncbi:hypothetical protein ACO2Q3_17095 [Caulobacter sp. KR2-114]|uniref:hypothetical protein n=1 Tax=Caulobacter sp. KR2-114 TaxID=3400912 RepID=UPI003C0EBB78